MVPRDCQTLAGSLLGFLATRAHLPAVTVRVFFSIFNKLTNLTGNRSLSASFIVAHVTVVGSFVQNVASNMVVMWLLIVCCIIRLYHRELFMSQEA